MRIYEAGTLPKPLETLCQALYIETENLVYMIKARSATDEP
jgi:hypothetical protein